MGEYKNIMKLVDSKLEEQEGVIEYYRKITAEKDAIISKQADVIREQQYEIENLTEQLESANREIERMSKND